MNVLLTEDLARAIVNVDNGFLNVTEESMDELPETLEQHRAWVDLVRIAAKEYWLEPRRRLWSKIPDPPGKVQFLVDLARVEIGDQLTLVRNGRAVTLTVTGATDPSD
jgi:hypothetical protein